jgi:hydroxymethylpyrimidine/phosphomethylpyrimidine kinase
MSRRSQKAMPRRGQIPRLLTIAGSDSGGGAGIQADLKAFAACRTHGMCAITAITAQNTVGVAAIHHVPGEIVIAQVRAVAQDIGVDAVKIGMLGTVETIEAVAEALALLAPGTPVVLDPVMVAESGAALLESRARGALISRLVARASVITPNLWEARELLAAAGATRSAAASDPAGLRDERLARELLALGAGAVVVTGGHRHNAADLFCDGGEVVALSGPRHPDGAAHGSGCTHSSVLAARLAWGDTPLQAAREAKRLASLAVAQGLGFLGAGPGPVDVLGLLCG